VGGRLDACGYGGSTRRRQSKRAAPIENQTLERLLGAPERVVKFLTEAPVACVSHALAFVKSFWPEAPLGMFAQGVAAECTKEQFKKYLQEAQLVAEQIVQSVLQD
jgi:hypothetical protein